MTPYELALRFVNEVRERAGTADDPFILWCLESCPHEDPLHDEIPWCSAFVNRINWIRRCPRSKSLRALSWLDVGEAIILQTAKVGYDIAVLSQEGSTTAGHVGYFAGYDGSVHVLGGNQSNRVSIASYPTMRLKGIRRCLPVT